MTSTNYHLIEIDPGGQVIAVRLLDDDVDERRAHEQARQLARGRVVELWRGMRLVGRFEPSFGEMPHLKF